MIRVPGPPSLTAPFILYRFGRFGPGVCVSITAGPITKLFAGGGGGEWRTCAMRDDEPRPVWMMKVYRVKQYAKSERW